MSVWERSHILDFIDDKITQNSQLTHPIIDKYEFGDISKFVLEAIDDDDIDDKSKDAQTVTKEGVESSDERKKKLSLNGSMFNSDDPKSAELIQKELEDWDKKFLVQLKDENADASSEKGASDKQQEKAR